MTGSEAHLDANLLLDVCDGVLPATIATESLLDHLRQVCPECAEEWARFEEYRRARAASHDYSDAFERASEEAERRQHLLQRDAGKAAREVEELLDIRDHAERSGRVERATRRFRSPAFVEAMIDAARGWLRHDPHEAVALMAIAERQAERIASWTYGEDLAARCLARARAHRGNALRVAGELAAADGRFSLLHKHLRRYPLADPALHAELLSLEASLRHDQRRLTDAEALLDSAAGLCLREGDRTGLGRVLLQQGICRSVGDRPDEALVSFSRAAELLDVEELPDLYLSAQHGRALCFCQLAEHTAAREVIEEHRLLYQQYDDPWTRLRWRWVEGKVSAGLDEDETAVATLAAVRGEYVERKLPYDAAMVALDLAEVRLRRGEAAEVKRLAEDMVATFERLDVHREAMQAAALFARAATAQRVTLELIVRLRGYLERAQHDPAHRFELPA
jgi:hypothetical protein